MMALAFISYAYYIKFNDVYNPDANERYNEFLDNVTKLNLCTKLSNDSWTMGKSHKPKSVNLTQILLKDKKANKATGEYQTISFQLSISVTISVAPKRTDLFPRPITGFVSTFPASLLGTVGPNENKSVAIEMVPDAPVNLKCADSQKVCVVECSMCASILAPDGVIPYAKQQTNQCSNKRDNSTNAFIAWLDISSSSKTETEHSVSECKSNILLKASHFKERLTVMLTLEKRSLVNMHLMHSSYFLFVIIITILLFGVITGGGERKHSRNTANHYSLMNSGMA